MPVHCIIYMYYPVYRIGRTPPSSLRPPAPVVLQACKMERENYTLFISVYVAWVQVIAAQPKHLFCRERKRKSCVWARVKPYYFTLLHQYVPNLTHFWCFALIGWWLGVALNSRSELFSQSAPVPEPRYKTSFVAPAFKSAPLKNSI